MPDRGVQLRAALPDRGQPHGSIRSRLLGRLADHLGVALTYTMITIPERAGRQAN